MSRSSFISALESYAKEGRKVHLWLRDDDAVEPTEALSRLLQMSTDRDIPITLAAIPAHAGTPLAKLVQATPLVSVAVHGWDHVNHAPPGQKKQELGLHRETPIVLSSLGEGLSRISALFGSQAVPLLVPPWNRIDHALVDALPALGYDSLSVFGPERARPALTVVNTHVDIIDWKGSRGGRDSEALYAEAATRLQQAQGGETVIGILTHHLVHDEAAWHFLDDLAALTQAQSACRWVSVRELISKG